MVSNEERQMIRMVTEAVFPGAIEARVDVFILRDMESNPLLVERYKYGLAWLNEESVRSYRKNLLELNCDQLTGLLTMIESSEFFRFVRDHTLEGMFSDPIYGGNYEAYGWRLLGYAGPTYHPPEPLMKVKPPTLYYSLEGIAYEEKNGL